MEGAWVVLVVYCYFKKYLYIHFQAIAKYDPGGRVLFEKDTGKARITTGKYAGGPPPKAAVFSHNK
jgi:hypothetical protein